MSRGLFAVLAVVLAVGVVTGSGAFTLVSAERGATVPVVTDASAVLGLAPGTGPNGQYAVVDPETGELGVDVSRARSGAAGEGLNTNARVVLADVFEVRNQGTEPVRVWVEFEHDQQTSVFATDPETGERVEIDTLEEAVELEVGETLSVGFEVDTTGVSPGTDLAGSIRISAVATRVTVPVPDDTSPPDTGGVIEVDPDEFEPNNLRTQATHIFPGAYTGMTIGDVGDVDWYRVSPVPTGLVTTAVVQVSEEPSSSSGTLFVRLEDGSGNVLDEASGSTAQVSYSYTQFNEPSALYVRVTGSDTPAIHSYTLAVGEA